MVSRMMNMSSSGATYKQQGDINQLDDKEFRWFAVYTKFKCEKFVANQLSKKGIEAYVPTIHKTKKYQRKVKHYEVPLINCYVFVKIVKASYVPTLETEFVMKFLKNGKDLLSIPESEMEILKRVVGDASASIPCGQFDWENVDDVEVMEGYLAGMKGKIVSRAGKHSFVIELETIGYQLRINIDPAILRPIQNNTLIA